MNIFFSWSGERSKLLAACFRDWLPMILQSTRPWFSPDDIDKGSRWLHELTTQLQDQQVGLVFLTPENVAAPWLVFESGALSKSLAAGRVCPVLLDLEPNDVTGPLAQFQGTPATREDILRLITDINRLSPTSVPDGQLARLFDLAWPELEQRIRGIPKTSPRRSPARKTEDILEEVLSRLRQLEGQSGLTGNRLDEIANSVRMLETHPVSRAAQIGARNLDATGLVTKILNQAAILNLEIELIAERRDAIEVQIHDEGTSDARQALINQRLLLRGKESDLRHELSRLHDELAALADRSRA